MEWVGIAGCVTLCVALICRARQLWKAKERSRARYSVATALYICLFAWIIVDYYNSESLLTAVVTTFPVEIAIVLLIAFHIGLLVHSLKHPPFSSQANWPDARRTMLRQAAFLAEISLVCLYTYLGVLYRDASLYLAAENGNYIQAQRCLSLGADPAHLQATDLSDASDNNCLIVALDHGNLRVASLLIQNGVSTEELDPVTRLTPLMTECTRHNLRAVEFLIQNGTNINQSTGNGITALKCAAGDTEIATVLIHHGIFVNTANFDGETAIFDFARAGNWTGVRELLHQNAKAKIVTRSGYSPLMAAACNGNPQTLSELIAAGVDLKAQDDMGHSALWYARQANHKKACLVIERAIKSQDGRHRLHNWELNDTLTL